MRLATSVGLLGLALIVAGCQRARPMAFGDARRGAFVIEQSQCGSCHRIPGIPSANGLSGPPLTGFASRSMIAGMLPNTPDDLVAWLRSPQTVVPGNAMPDMDLSRRQALDAAAYLEGLK